MSQKVPGMVSRVTRKLTPVQFQHLGDVPPELEWFSNIDNEKTRRAYKIDLEDFTTFAGIRAPEDLRLITRSHVLAWRKKLEHEELSPATIRRKLSALFSLYDYLCEHNAVTHNPVKGVKRPKSNCNEGTTPAIGDAEAPALLDQPDGNTLKGKRDRAILATLLYHGIRREELCTLWVKDLENRQGVAHLRIFGKGSKIRFLAAHLVAQRLIKDNLDHAGHGDDAEGPPLPPRAG